jgi:hypothetical protein
MRLPLKNIKILFFGLLFIATSNALLSQTKEDLANYRKKYPGQHLVQTKSVHRITIKMVKSIPTVTHFYEWDYLILDKNGIISLSESSIDFSPFETISNIDAYSLVPTEKGSKKIEASNFITKDGEADNGIFHDGTKTTSFVYGGLSEGALRHLSYEVAVSDNSFPFGYSFYGMIPCENPQLIIEMDSCIHLKSKLFNNEKFPINFSESLNKGKRIMTWSTPEDLILKSEEMAPNNRFYAPHVLAQIAYYYTKNGRQQLIETITDLHNNYKKNITEVENEVPSKEIAEIADSITKNLTTNFDKVQAIYYWVQDHIKYIAFEEGDGGFVPRQPSRIIEKRYGDCKDMASLIYSMTKAINIPTYLTWIGSRSLPYKYTEFPSSFCDNHMITTYKENGNYYFLDATNSFQPISLPTGFIQEKEAFIHLGPDEFEIVNVPTPDYKTTRMVDSSFIQLQEKNLIGTTRSISTGYYHIYLGNLAKSVPVKEYHNFITSINERGNNSFAITNEKVTGIDNRDGLTKMSFDWKVQNYATVLDNEIYVNMILNKDFVQQGEFKKTRIAPSEMENHFSDTYVTTLTIPVGYKLKSLPKNNLFDTDFVHYSIDYKQTGNTIVMTLTFDLTFLLLAPERFEEWNNFIKTKKAALAESVVLIKQ